MREGVRKPPGDPLKFWVPTHYYQVIQSRNLLTKPKNLEHIAKSKNLTAWRHATNSRIFLLGWNDEKVSSSSLLKLIYHGIYSITLWYMMTQMRINNLGRFLHGSVILSALNIPAGKTTVMHLVTRENLPEPSIG